MYAVTGITGQAGGATARALLDAGQGVRAIVRTADKDKPWAQEGCEAAVATITDARALTDAFSDVEGVFLMTPPNFDPEPGFPQTREIVDAVRAALQGAQPEKIVFLSTVGAQVKEPNLLNNSTMVEVGLRSLSLPVAFLRAAWFMENATWDVPAARRGNVPSFLQPLDHRFPWWPQRTSVASRLRSCATHGPARASSSSRGPAAMRRTTSLRASPPRLGIRCEWSRSRATHGRPSSGLRAPNTPFRASACSNGFNEGWIDFEGGAAEHRKGRIPLELVLKDLVARAG